MRFQKLDLNLLIALDALLAESSVSGAADRIHLSQSGMSSALNRLREYFNDELLLVRGGKMVLTPRAEELQAPVRKVLMEIKANITTRPQFRPGESERHFTLVASDYSISVVLAGALQKIACLAPDLTFEFLPVEDSPIGRLERGEADLWVTLDHAASPDNPSELLFEDDYVVVAWDGNSAIRGRLDKTLYFDLGHVSTRFGKARQPAFEESFLQSLQARRRIEVVAPSFSMAPALVVGTDRIATMHRRLADIAARSWPLRVYPMPIAMPPIRQVAQWSRSQADDPGLRWLVNEIQAHVEAISVSDSTSLAA